MSEELWRDKPSIMVFCGSPLIRGKKKKQWASTEQRMDCLSRHNSSLIGRKNPAKFEHDCILRSAHRFKITQPNLTILVSFSSAEDVLSNDVKKKKKKKKNEIFGLQGILKIRRSAFFGTRGIVGHHDLFKYSSIRQSVVTSQILEECHLRGRHTRN